ncbi:MAG: hypothetical protein ABI772_10045 [Bacteroidota bacterium]
MNYLKLFEKLNESDVRYVICGGLAVNLHGIPRMTADIDIILDLNKSNIEKFMEAVKSLHYELTLPLKAEDIWEESKRQSLIKDKNLIALSFYNYDDNTVMLDVLLDFPILFNELWQNKVTRKSGNAEIYVVSIDHLISLKEYSNRIQDQQDILFLSKIKNGQNNN